SAALIGEWRGSLCGHNCLLASCCCRKSGDALMSSQSVPSVLTAIDACVRGLALIRPSRPPPLVRALPFHRGKPPPAADPKTTMNMIAIRYPIGRPADAIDYIRALA